jgi:hypothetical protein
MLDQAVSKEENLAVACVCSCSLRTKPPTQADWVGEVEPISPYKALDHHDKSDHPENAEWDLLFPMSVRGRRIGILFRGQRSVNA